MRNRRLLTRLACAALFLLAATKHASAQRWPDEELKSLEAADGLEVSLFASEPFITNPAAIDVDTHGRVWVAEIEWYRAAAKEPGADKIKVLEDTDGDGRADRATIFAEDLFCPMSVCVAGTKVYVATSPDLWVYEDADGDLKADGPPVKLLSGFKGHNHDHGAHSLVLGPDHKWWMSHGDAGFDVTGTDGGKIEYQWGACMRGELDGSRLELVAKNFRNPYEVCVSSFGEAYLSDNDNDGNFSARICWLLEGGNYGWFGHPPIKVPPSTPLAEHWHFRGHVPGYVPATLVTGFGSPCGMCFYEGDAFGPHYKNAPLHTDAGPREVRLYRHDKAGAGMRATSEVILSSRDDKYFRPDDICAAPDGSLYVSDWYDGGVGGHAYNNPNQGRIFVLRPKGKTLARFGKPGPYSTIEDATEGLQNPNLATQYLARERLLAAGQASVPALTKLLAAEDPNYRARALWVLDRIGGEARQAVVEQLGSPSGRAGACRADFAAARRRLSAQILALVDDPEIEVRREVLLALGAWRGEQIDAALLRLAKSYDGTDRYLLEAINIAAADRQKQLAAALDRAGLVSLDNVDLIQALDADAAARFVIAALAGGDLDSAARSRLFVRLGTTKSLEAADAVLSAALDRSAPTELREEALATVSRNLAGDWKDLAEKPELLSGIAQMLGEARLRLVGDRPGREAQPGRRRADALGRGAFGRLACGRACRRDPRRGEVENRGRSRCRGITAPRAELAARRGGRQGARRFRFVDADQEAARLGRGAVGNEIDRGRPRNEQRGRVARALALRRGRSTGRRSAPKSSLRPPATSTRAFARSSSVLCRRPSGPRRSAPRCARRKSWL